LEAAIGALCPYSGRPEIILRRLGLLLIYLPSERLYGLFVFGWCKSPNLIWLPALRTNAAAAPTAAA